MDSLYPASEASDPTPTIGQFGGRPGRGDWASGTRGSNGDSGLGAPHYRELVGRTGIDDGPKTGLSGASRPGSGLRGRRMWDRALE
jgi:hypothetical protein